jgi:hypothetical protein
MPQRGLIVRALIASPSDVSEERKDITEVILAWNAAHSRQRGIIIEPVKWESHAVPGLEGRPQEMINKQLVASCDFLIGVFWTRLGSPTGVAESGTAEEIEEFRKAGKPVLLYISTRPCDPSLSDQGQRRKLEKYLAKIKKQGLIYQYSELSELREKLLGHLTSVIDRIEQAETESLQKARKKTRRPTRRS